jgi:hypothetical protein
MALSFGHSSSSVSDEMTQTFNVTLYDKSVSTSREYIAEQFVAFSDVVTLLVFVPVFSISGIGVVVETSYESGLHNLIQSSTVDIEASTNIFESVFVSLVSKIRSTAVWAS